MWISLLAAIWVQGAQLERLSPKIYTCEHFLTDGECDYLVELAKPRLTRALIVDEYGNQVIDPGRTSEGMFITEQDLIVNKLNQKIAELTGFPTSHGEDFQILHYPIGGEYRPHYDTFNPDSPAAEYLRFGGQRVATFMIYLNTTASGGETHFPLAGLSITPKKGKAVLFYNVDDLGNIDEMSLHAGRPVLEGEKWIITRWLRQDQIQPRY